MVTEAQDAGAPITVDADTEDVSHRGARGLYLAETGELNGTYVVAWT